MRGASGKELHNGFGYLYTWEKAKVKESNILCRNTAGLLLVHLERRIPFIYEQPWPVEVGPHMTNMDCFEDVLRALLWDIS